MAYQFYPCKMVKLWSTELKAVYKGNTKIRPRTWQLNSNTLLYMPFKTDTKNQVNNTSYVASSWVTLVTTGVGYLDVSEWYATYNLPTSILWWNPFTYNVWYYLYNTNASARRILFIPWGLEVRFSGDQRYQQQWIPLGTIISNGDSDGYWITHWFRTTLNEWHNLCVTFDGTTIIQYLDRQKLVVGIPYDWSASSTWTQALVGTTGSTDRYNGRVSEVIFEKWAWVDWDVYGYYDDTKWNYISS